MQTTHPDRETVAARLDELVAAYNRQDAAAVVALFADHGVFIDVDGTEHTGHAAIERDHTERFGRSPGSRFEVDIVAIEGAVATATWRRHRAADGSGEHDSWRGVDVIRFDAAGAIVVKSTYAKTTAPANERVADQPG